MAKVAKSAVTRAVNNKEQERQEEEEEEEEEEDAEQEESGARKKNKREKKKKKKKKKTKKKKKKKKKLATAIDQRYSEGTCAMYPCGGGNRSRRARNRSEQSGAKKKKKPWYGSADTRFSELLALPSRSKDKRKAGFRINDSTGGFALHAWAIVSDDDENKEEEDEEEQEEDEVDVAVRVYQKRQASGRASGSAENAFCLKLPYSHSELRAKGYGLIASVVFRAQRSVQCLRIYLALINDRRREGKQPKARLSPLEIGSTNYKTIVDAKMNKMNIKYRDPSPMTLSVRYTYYQGDPPESQSEGFSRRS
ncbi:hypothetical protein EAI_02852 [Harpegnathos saltator]|uniref:Uncharacterized protein n=1 Tax=Harpegnathos saltator TaxID=610380 RepID=E2C6R7_HARSA|nr:hypothetical protein EAI_02852 [Harpegnathos saltator]